MAQKRRTAKAAPKAAQTPVLTASSEGAILILARLIGRQIAREQFERKIALERKAQKKRAGDGDA